LAERVKSLCAVVVVVVVAAAVAVVRPSEGAHTGVEVLEGRDKSKYTCKNVVLTSA
jgi:hypothetical protein